MTRRPLETHDVEGLNGPDYELNILCAAPGCMERSADRHHIWRRSFLGGAFNWVILPDDSQVGNIVCLCRLHHDQVTNDAVQITWENECFMWSDLISVSRQLAFQPPHVLGETFDTTPLQLHDVTIDDQAVDEHEHKENECPTCHQPFPKPKVEKPKEEKRPRRTWSITVPVDQRENGAETLDTLLEEARTEMAKVGIHYGAEDSTRWAVLSGALALFVSHFDSIVAAA